MYLSGSVYYRAAEKYTPLHVHVKMVVGRGEAVSFLRNSSTS